MLLSEIIYNIKNLKNGGVTSDDDDITNSQWAFIINYYRAKLIKQDHEKSAQVDQSTIQNLGKVDLIMADKNECCEIDVCTLRTATKVPEPLEYKGKMFFTYVGLLDNKPFQRTTHNRSAWDKYRRYTRKEATWYYQGGYLYIQNPPSDILQYINIQGIFEDPKAALSFRTCDCPGNGEDCFVGFDFNYPMDLQHMDTIVKMIAASELRLQMIMPEDTTNDTQDINPNN